MDGRNTTIRIEKYIQWLKFSQNQQNWIQKKSMLRTNNMLILLLNISRKKQDGGKLNMWKKEDIYNRIDWKETKKALVNARTCSKTKKYVCKIVKVCAEKYWISYQQRMVVKKISESVATAKPWCGIDLLGEMTEKTEEIWSLNLKKTHENCQKKNRMNFK